MPFSLQVLPSESQTSGAEGSESVGGGV